MDILFLSSSFASRYGGAAHSEQGLVKCLSETESVTLLSRRERYDTHFAEALNIKRTILFTPLEILAAFFNLNKRLSHAIQKADIFHLNGHWFFENYFFARLCKRYQIPYVLHPRGMLLVGHRRKYLKRIFNVLIGNYIVKNADKIIALSQYEKRQFVPYDVDQRKIAVIPNGIIVPDFTTRQKARQKYFLYFGRIESRKNLEFLIECFSNATFKDKSIELLLVGPVEHGYDKLLQQCILKRSLQSKIKILPAVYGDEKWRMLSAALAVVYPAVHEAFGRVPFEALGSGGLAIVPELSGGAEYLKNIVPELIYNEGDSESLIRKLRAVEALSEADRESLRELTKSWVSENLSWNKIRLQVLILYQKLHSECPITSPINGNLGPGSF